MHFHFPTHFLLQAKGYPDFATRMFLLRLSETFNLPLYALMDGDPHGENCFCQLKIF